MSGGETISRLQSVMHDLDMLDNAQDDRYTYAEEDIYLRSVMTSTGACSLAGDAVGGSGIQARIRGGLGDGVSVDCGTLVSQLRTLTDIAERLPMYHYLAGDPAIRTVTTGDMWVYHFVNHIISELLRGGFTTSQTFSEMFGSIPFEIYRVAIENLFDNNPGFSSIIVGQPLNITTAQAAFTLFSAEAREHGFSVAPFVPSQAPPSP